MDYKTFISSMTAGECIFIATIETSYDDFLLAMSLGKALYFSDETFYSVILSVSINDLFISYTYYSPDGQYIEKVINR